jgi:hypothetical protein
MDLQEHNQSMAKGQRQYNGEKMAFSTNEAGTAGWPHSPKTH